MKHWGWLAAGLAVLFVVVIPVGIGRFIWQQLPPPKDMGAFASAFGDVVGPLFAALAFAGLIVTALMQREELSLQRRELKETRRVLQAQLETERLAASLNAATVLLEHHEKLRSTIEINGEANRWQIMGIAAIHGEINKARERIVVISRTLDELVEEQQRE